MRNKETQHINVIFKQQVDALFSLLLSRSTILICEENTTFNIRKNSFTLNISIKTQSCTSFKIPPKRDLPGGGEEPALAKQRAQVQSLVRELRSHMLHNTAKKKKLPMKPSISHWSLFPYFACYILGSILECLLTIRIKDLARQL